MDFFDGQQNRTMTNSSLKAAPQRYGAVAQALHWLTAILVLIAFIYGPGGSEKRIYSSARDFDRQLHETLGLCVLILSVVRFAWRLVDRQPDPEQGPHWMSVTAKTVREAPLRAVVPRAADGAPSSLCAQGWCVAVHDAAALENAADRRLFRECLPERS